MELDDIIAGLEPARGRRSRAASWYEDKQRLVGVSRERPGPRSLNLLAYGLQDLDGRTLELVVPAGAATVIRAQAAWLTTKVLVYPFKAKRAGTVGRAVYPAQTPMSPTESGRLYRKLGGLTPPISIDAVPWPPWFKELVDLMERRGAERWHTTRSVVWRYRGRQVLALRPAGSGTLELVAGADVTSTGRDRPTPYRRTVTAGMALTEADLNDLRSAVDAAIEHRRNGADRGHRERLLQATISGNPGLIGMSDVLREVPAWRPKYTASRGRASIDLLGCDTDQVGHVIEVKIRPDPQLGIQALDYWTWAEAHRAELAKTIGADPDQPFRLDLVLGGKAAEGPVHPAAAATLNALAPEVNWRCHIITDWDTIEEPKRPLTPGAESVPPRQLL